jgi:hypothetical protein
MKISFDGNKKEICEFIKDFSKKNVNSENEFSESESSDEIELNLEDCVITDLLDIKIKANVRDKLGERKTVVLNILNPRNAVIKQTKEIDYYGDKKIQVDIKTNTTGMIFTNN